MRLKRKDLSNWDDGAKVGGGGGSVRGTGRAVNTESFGPHGIQLGARFFFSEGYKNTPRIPAAQPSKARYEFINSYPGRRGWGCYNPASLLTDSPTHRRRKPPNSHMITISITVSLRITQFTAHRASTLEVN